MLFQIGVSAPDATLHELGIDERLALLVDAEWIERQNKRLARALREAKLRIPQARLEDTEPRRELDRKRLRALATCAWIQAHRKIARALGRKVTLQELLAEAYNDLFKRHRLAELAPADTRGESLSD